MKKSIWLGAMTAMMLFASSCQNDEYSEGMEGQTSVVSFTLEQPSIASRGYSDGTKATHLQWVVYNSEKTMVKEGTSSFTNKQSPVTIKFNADQIGQSYTFVFWADAYGNAEDSPYLFSKEDGVIIDMEVLGGSLMGNNENRDAFFATETLTVTQQGIEKVVALKRPFAQLNIGFKGDLVSFSPAKSSVTVSQVYTTLNLIDGTVDQPTNVEYTLADIPSSETEVFPVGENIKYLAMNYLLVDQEKEILDKVKYGFAGANEATASKTGEVTNVPVQRNYRTNIILEGGMAGDNTIVFSANIDERYEQPDYNVPGVKLGDKSYNTLKEALANAVPGDIINLEAGEFELPVDIKLKGNATGSITLVGKGEGTVIDGVAWPNQSKPGEFVYHEPMHAWGLALTMKNLTFETNHNWNTGGFAHSKSVTFEDCTIIGGFRTQGGNDVEPTLFKNCKIDPLDDYIEVYGMDCVFDGCTFTSSEGKAIQVYSEGNGATVNATIKDCTFIAAKAATTSSGKPVSAIDINSIQKNNLNVSISNSTATGYGVGEVSGSSLWDIKGEDGSITVTINNVKVYPNN